MTKEEYKEKLLDVYTELIEEYKDDRQKLHEIDLAFCKPLEEINK